MIRAGKLVFTVAAAAILLAYSADCFAPGRMDAEAMECCASMPCTPANQNHDCCKTMASGQTPSALLTARVSLSAPLLAVIEHQPTLEVFSFVPAILQPAKAQQHPPPELYTLYGSLLI